MMDSSGSDNSDVNTDAELDILSESRCVPLLPVLKQLDATFEDVKKTFKEKTEVLVIVWQKIVDFIVTQPSKKLNEEIFEYAYPDTISILLDVNWLTVDDVIKEQLSASFQRCLTYFDQFNSVSVININSLLKLVETPWEDPTLKRIINNYNEVSHEEQTEFFKSENLLLISTRIKILIMAKSEDLALQLVNAVVKFTGILPSSWIDVYIRVMTTMINDIEEYKTQNDSIRLRHAEKRLSKLLLLLVDVMKNHVGISRELVLTAFSLNPTKECYSLIKYFHRKCDRMNMNSKIDIKAVLPETGRLIVRSSNYDPLRVPSYVFEECEEIGLSKQVTSDLLSIITNQRFKKLSWMYSWKKLKADCEIYMKNGVEMRNPNKELKYLKIDYSIFK